MLDGCGEGSSLGACPRKGHIQAMTAPPTPDDRQPDLSDVPPPAGPSVPLPPNPDDKREPAAPLEKVPVDDRPDPTRYGDWEINGRCIDF